MKNVHFHQRLKCSLGKQLPAWDPGKVKLPGFSAKKNDCKTRPENLTNKILEFYPNSCSSPSRSPDALGSDGCCNTEFEVSPVWCQELAPRDKDRTVALLMGAENNPPPTTQTLCFVVKLSLCLWGEIKILAMSNLKGRFPGREGRGVRVGAGKIQSQWIYGGFGDRKSHGPWLN